jgi:hypothetical protein
MRCRSWEGWKDGEVSINRAGIAGMMQEIQREFDKHPIKVSVQADDAAVRLGQTTVYNGPVIQGDANGAQLAWGNETVAQLRHEHLEQIASGYPALAQALVSTLEELPAAELELNDERDAEAAACEALAALTEAQPDQGVIRRAVAAFKGHLALVAAGLVSGTAQGAQEWAKTAIQHLHLP